MDILLAVFLGLVQGITEWLPVSSSGHLVIIQILAGYHNSVIFDIMVHGGTLLAVIIFFWREFLALLKNFVLTFVDIFKIGKRAFYRDEERRLTWYVIFATVPIVIVGLALQDYINIIFNSLLLVGFALLVTGAWLFSTKNKNGKNELNIKNTFIVGLAQAAAIIPGISRSGSTISTAMLLNVDRVKAAKFSFLLSIPSVGGAITLEILSTPLKNVLTAPNIAGFITSFVVGILTIKFLLEVIKRGKFFLFSIYCWLLGSAVIIIGLMR